MIQKFVTILCTVIFQQIGQLRKNGQISRKIYLPSLNQEETENLNRMISKSKNEFVIKNSEKYSRTGWIHKRILPNI